MFAEGAVVGEYTLQRKLGQGPLAQVWRARKVDRTEPVALKLLRPGALTPAEMRKYFDRLVQVLSEIGRLEHPHLPATLGTVRRPSDGLFGLAIPYSDGGPLFDAGDLTDPSALRDALELVVQLGQTVMWLHDQGIVHGAIKPTNVLASPSLTGPSIRLLDLCWSRAGLCRLEGTRFEPPEVADGSVTPAADQWAIARLVRSLVARRAPEPISAWAHVPEDLRNAVDRSLSPDPRQRFERTADLIDALVAAQTGLSSTTSVSSDPGTIPDPTVPVPKEQPPPSVESLAADPTEEAIPKPRDDAPTEPAIEQEDQAEVSRLAAAARTVDIESAPEPSGPRTGGGLARIDPSADAGTPSEMVKPVPRPADPTDPLPPPPPPERTAPLPFIIAAAAAATIAIYAWTVTSSEDPETQPTTAVRPSPAAAVRRSPAAAVRPSPAASVANARTSPGKRSARPPVDGNRPPPIPDATLARSTVTVPPSTKPTTSKKNAESGATPPTSPNPKPTLSSAKPAPDAPTPSKQDALSEPAPTTKKDVDVAAKDYAWGDCINGVRRACIALAEQHERLGHWRAAAKSRDQACRRGHRGSCLTAASHYLKAKQGRVARRRYEYLCDNRDARACAELSTLFRRGIGGRRSQRTADAFKLRACQLGHRPSCS